VFTAAVAPVKSIVKNTVAYNTGEVFKSSIMVIYVYYHMLQPHVSQEIHQVAIDMHNIVLEVDGCRGVAYTLANGGFMFTAVGGIA
jgi:hypothetical protein